MATIQTDRIAWVLALGLTVPQAALAADGPAWPEGVQKKDDPRILAFYDAQCAQWADGNGLAADARDAFIKKCRTDAAGTYPVGMAPPPVGSSE
jgi:hypothetical protein